MTKDEILAIKAGEKLDAHIAEWKDGCYHDWKGQSLSHGGLTLKCTKCRAVRESGQRLPNQNYSTDISAAWQVVEKIRTEHNVNSFVRQLGRLFQIGKSVSWSTTLNILFNYGGFEPVNICKAALLTKTEEQ